MEATPVAGVILAGGLSRRMGGGDKGLHVLGATSMLQHVVDRIRPQIGPLIVNANGDPARFSFLGLPIVPDPVAGYVGPLAGILAGMQWCCTHASTVRRIVSVTSDTPFLPAGLVMRLAAAVENQPLAIALAESDGGVHPATALWPVALADDLEGQLGGGMRRVMQWAGRHTTIAVRFEPVEINGRLVDPFFNANTPEDLAEARAILAG
jgi:molybdopterin-guanine dinucleotide biosynthesis protein A